MMILIAYMLFIYLLVMMLMLMNFLFMKKKNKSREKNSPFECGFDPLDESRSSFSIQFYLIGVIFLIFDVEIVFLFPLIYEILMFLYYKIIMLFVFLLILLIGLYIEWKEGALKWVK
uniref:NADH-ubiquinone oxidoreductase chain 3 n=1 Tax=Monomachus antipodalis TaxID=161211 RepID=A0A0E3IC68_9HYME|nr:NADH dehydrogenase subunit 3 [Monomachus antipodalis]